MRNLSVVVKVPQVKMLLNEKYANTKLHNSTVRIKISFIGRVHAQTGNLIPVFL